MMTAAGESFLAAAELNEYLPILAFICTLVGGLIIGYFIGKHQP